MKYNHKRFIQYGLALTAGLGLGAFSMASPSEAILAFNGIHVNGLNTNGISLNGITFNGLSVNGLSFKGIGNKGISLHDFDQITPNTTTAKLTGKPVQELTLEGGQLVFRLPSAQQ